MLAAALTGPPSSDDIINDDNASDADLTNRLKHAAATTLRNTTGTSNFYKPYKSRKASAGIQELWSIDSWEAASISKESHVANREATNATTPTTVLHQARKYYVWLFSAKEHLLETDALNTFARCLTTNPIPLAAREACELAISDKEGRQPLGLTSLQSRPTIKRTGNHLRPSLLASS